MVEVDGWLISFVGGMYSSLMADSSLLVNSSVVVVMSSSKLSCSVLGDVIAKSSWGQTMDGVLQLYKYDEDVDGVVHVQVPILADSASMSLSHDYLVYQLLDGEDLYLSTTKRK